MTETRASGTGTITLSEPPQHAAAAPSMPWVYPSAPALPPCPCGCPADAHDSVATRYCTSTFAGGLCRGCICLPTAEPRAR